MTYQSYDLPRLQWLPNAITMENTGQFHFDSFRVLSISLLLMKNHNHYAMLLISHYLFCICTCTFIYTAYMQMTLPIHVNTLTLNNYFISLGFLDGTWLQPFATREERLHHF